ncbi:hypothetical protein J4407_02355 [Candidatus Pacearchaeota archaeon]|nr:hypothetical protein [Candidatus Pacearchaeota archaeon]
MGGGLMKEDISFLNQLAKALEEAESKLERAYEKKDYKSFIEAKKIIIKIQKEILDRIK